MKKVLAVLLAVAMMTVMLAGCGSSGNKQGFSKSDAIKIGLSGPLTGDAAAYGVAVKAGMEIAVEEINAKGGLQIEFEAQDDEADGDKAVNAYNTLKDKGMQFLAGAVTTGSCNAVAPMAVEDQILMMTPSGSAEAIALAGNSVYRCASPTPTRAPTLHS